MLRKLEDPQARTLKKNLLNLVDVEEMPFVLQEEFTRSKLSIPPHIWDSYDTEVRGRAIAAEALSSRLELIERFYRELERNKETNKPKEVAGE